MGMGAIMTGASLIATAENPNTPTNLDAPTKHYHADLSNFKPDLNVEKNDKGEIISIKYVKLNEDGYIISLEQAGELISPKEIGPLNKLDTLNNLNNLDKLSKLDTLNNNITFQKRDPSGNLILNFSSMGKYKILHPGTPLQKEVVLTKQEERIINEQIIELYTNEIKQSL